MFGGVFTPESPARLACRGRDQAPVAIDNQGDCEAQNYKWVGASQGSWDRHNELLAVIRPRRQRTSCWRCNQTVR